MSYQAAVAQKVDAIIVNPVDTDASPKITKIVSDAKIPLIHVNRKAVDFDKLPAGASDDTPPRPGTPPGLAPHVVAPFVTTARNQVIMNSPTFEQLESDVHGALSSAQNVLEQAVGTNSEKSAELRARALSKLKTARETLAAASGKAVERSKAAAKVTDEYVHTHPWRIIGSALAIGVALGLLINRGR